MADYNKNLWAPWRMEYLRSLREETEDSGCFFCRYLAQPEQDQANLVVWRGQNCFVVMNRFPYTNGHLLVAVNSHVGDPLALEPAEASELASTTWQVVDLLRAVLDPEGFNVGTNLGHAAGAGVPDHLHTHVVPRWGGDTNYMAVLGDTRVVPDSLTALYAQLTQRAAAMGLRDTPPGSAV